MLARAESVPVCRDVLTTFGYRCSRCEATGYRRAEQRAEKESLAQLIRRTLNAGLYTREAMEHTFSTSDPACETQNAAVWVQARQWTTKSPNLWVCGPKGTGKTYVCECILSGVLAQGVSVGAISAVEVNQSGQRYDAAERMRPYRGLSLLLLDDIDTPSWTRAGVDLLRDLLDYRYRTHHKTLVTANTEEDHFQRVLRGIRPDNPSIAGALVERLKPILRREMGGPSLRK